MEERPPVADHDAENREVERREIADLEGVVPLPGALDLLSSLPEDRWTIVTSCTRALAEVRIRAAGLPLPKKLAHLQLHHQRQAASRSLLEGRLQAGILARRLRGAGRRSGLFAPEKPRAQRSSHSPPRLNPQSLRTGADWVLQSCADIALAASAGQTRLSQNQLPSNGEKLTLSLHLGELRAYQHPCMTHPYSNSALSD